jgi:hypothetical protein
MQIDKLSSLPKSKEVDDCLYQQPPTPRSFSDRDLQYYKETALLFDSKSDIPIVGEFYRMFAYYFRFAYFAKFKRDHAEFETYLKVEELVNMYVGDYIVKSLSKNVNKEKYIIDTCSMVTNYIFQTPAIYGKDKIEREILTNVFYNWNPNVFVSDFNNKFKLKINSVK